MSKRDIARGLSGYPTALTVRETAEILRITSKTVYKMIENGSIPAVRVGRMHRIAKGELIDFLRKNETQRYVS